MRLEDSVERVDHAIVARTGRVLLAFVLVTGVFAVGLGGVSTEAGTEQFTEDVAAQDALTRINQEFTPPFETDTGSTQLIQRGGNVLAKPAMLRMLEAQERLTAREDLRVVSTSSAASLVARQLDPRARTIADQQAAIREATPGEVDAAVRALADRGLIQPLVSTDFNRGTASASATIAVVSHEVPAGLSATAGQGGTSPLTDIQVRAERIVGAVAPGITVFGSGLIADEFSQVIADSLLIVTPAALVFIVFFLVVAYRDLLDLLLGMVALGMAVVWTFGFLGLAGIAFNQVMIAIPPLMLAVGIDFGIHSINRYREERLRTDDADEAMSVAARQLVVAFFIVTGTTVIGFLANLVSDLPPIRDFGVVAAIGITFTFLIFGVFLPAAKLWVDRRRDGWPIPTFSQSPIAGGESTVGRVLRVGVVVARRAPVAFLVVVVLSSVVMTGYATGVDTTFTQEDFLPPEEVPASLRALPEPFQPSDYDVAATLDFLERKFQTTQGSSTTVYWETNMERDSALEEIRRANRDPPESFVTDGRYAASTSVLSVVRERAARDPAFRKLVARNDRDGNGIPDDNLGEVYDYLLSSPARERTLRYLAEDRRSTRVVYDVAADASNEEATADTRVLAGRFRGDAVATGSTVVFQAISDLIFRSAVLSLSVALAATVVFLVFVYWLLEGLPSLGLANTVPILVTVAYVGGTMRLVGIPFNAITATVLAITIGLGIDYSVHVVHRFVDERRAHDRWTALDRTVRGTGGALAGSMLTTTFGIGVLLLAILSILGQFGVLTALSVLYSFLASLLILPSVLVLWDGAVAEGPGVPLAAAAD